MMGEAGYFRIVLIHHAPNQEARPYRVGLRGAREFREVVAEHGAELILHGHSHESSIFAISATPATCRWWVSRQPALRRASGPMTTRRATISSRSNGSGMPGAVQCASSASSASAPMSCCG